MESQVIMPGEPTAGQSTGVILLSVFRPPGGQRDERGSREVHISQMKIKSGRKGTVMRNANERRGAEECNKSEV